MKPTRVLISGGSGFIGSNLVDKLVNSNLDFEIFVVDHKDPQYINNAVNYQKIDITTNSLHSFIEKISPEINIISIDKISNLLANGFKIQS